MKSVFNLSDKAEFIERINKLTPASQPLWGKMSVSQMLAHCQVVIKLAIGELQLKRSLLGVVFGNIAKRQILGDGPVKHNMPTFKQARITEEEGFDAEKAGLIKLVEKFAEGPEVITKARHPFFGPLTIAEWDTLQVKHLDHHLSQFGV
jgi:hypothetical protein